MCELDPDAINRATQSNLRAINTAFGNVSNIFAAAIKREHEKQAKYQAKTRNDDPPPERAA